MLPVWCVSLFSKQVVNGFEFVWRSRVCISFKPSTYSTTENTDNYNNILKEKKEKVKYSCVEPWTSSSVMNES